MIDYKTLFEYFRQCPYLSDMMSIAAEMEMDNKVIMPQGASPAVQYQEKIDALGNYECVIMPYPSVYEDFQINCYVYYNTKDNNPPTYNSNVLSYEKVCGVCDWIKEQNDNQNFPDIGEKVISVECNPFVPCPTGYTDPATNTNEYIITVRIRYVNRTEQRNVYYECEN